MMPLIPPIGPRSTQRTTTRKPKSLLRAPGAKTSRLAERQLPAGIHTKSSVTPPPKSIVRTSPARGSFCSSSATVIVLGPAQVAITLVVAGFQRLPDGSEG